MNRETAKKLTVMIGNFSAGFVVGNALRTMVPVDSKPKFVLRAVGIMVIGGFLSEHTAEYIERTFDKTAADLGFPMPEEEEV